MAERVLGGGGDTTGTGFIGPAVVYSDDTESTMFAATWTAATAPGWDNTYYSVVADMEIGPSDLLVGCGSTGGYAGSDLMLSSSDRGLNWTSLRGPTALDPSTGILTGIVYATSLGVWIVAGAMFSNFAAKVYSSSDLSTWTARSNSFDTTSGTGVGGTFGTTIDYGNGVIMQTGRNSTPDRWVARTTDLSTWSYPSSMTISTPRRVRYLNGNWFVCGATGSAPKLFRSTDDGVTFSDITPGSLGSATAFYDIAWNGTAYLLVAEVTTAGHTTAWTSTDLSTWTARSGMTLQKPRVAYGRTGVTPLTVGAVLGAAYTNNDGGIWSSGPGFSGRAATSVISLPVTATVPDPSPPEPPESHRSAPGHYHLWLTNVAQSVHTTDLVPGNDLSLGELVNAEVSTIQEDLNGDCTFSFRLPITDPMNTLLLPYTAEVIVRRGNTTIARGIPLRWRADPQSIEYQCVGIFWYLMKRHVGTGQRSNRLTNFSFESGLTGWSTGGDGTTPTVITTHHMRGPHGVNLYQTTGGKDAFIKQDNSVGPFTVDTTVQFRAWYHIRMDSPGGQFYQPAFDNRGIMMERIAPVGAPATSLENVKVGWLNAETTPGITRPTECFIKVPGDGYTYTLACRLYSPRGYIVWDACQLVLPEENYYEHGDIATIIKDLLMLAQTSPKPSLGIALAVNDVPFTGGAPLLGDTVMADYKAQDHPNIGDAIMALTQNGEHGCDVWMNPITRRLHLYTKKGSFKPECDLVLGKNVLSYQWSGDGAQAASRIMVRGSAMPSPATSANEEGLADDGTVLGGLLPEAVFDADPEHTWPDDLDGQALAKLRRMKYAPQTLIIDTETMPTLDLIAELLLGDTTLVNIPEPAFPWPTFNMTGTWRVVRRVINPQTDTCQFTLSNDLGED